MRLHFNDNYMIRITMYLMSGPVNIRVIEMRGKTEVILVMR